MKRRIAIALSALLAAFVLVTIAPGELHADDSRVARDLLERSRDAATDQEFSGRVAIEWVDGGDLHERTVDVSAEDGVLHLGGDRLIGAGSRRLLRTGAGWQLLWAAPARGAAPDPSRKYRFDVVRRSSVADRPATLVTIARAGSSDVRERMYFDVATGMLLRRDQLDARGKLVRRFAFVSMTPPRAVDGSKREVLPKAAPDSKRRAPDAMRDAPDELEAPKRIGRDFVLSGVYSQPDGSVQLYYSDGLLGLSVFERTGELDWSALPPGGRMVELRGTEARLYRTEAGTAVVWTEQGITFTCVTDAPDDELAAIAASLDHDEDGVLDQVGRFVTQPFSWG